eukprot:jgi/Mesvir1/5103/Mv15265-RA.1
MSRQQAAGCWQACPKLMTLVMGMQRLEPGRMPAAAAFNPGSSPSAKGARDIQPVKRRRSAFAKAFSCFRPSTAPKDTKGAKKPTDSGQPQKRQGSAHGSHEGSGAATSRRGLSPAPSHLSALRGSRVLNLPKGINSATAHPLGPHGPSHAPGKHASHGQHEASNWHRSRKDTKGGGSPARSSSRQSTPAGSRAQGAPGADARDPRDVAGAQRGKGEERGASRRHVRDAAGASDHHLSAGLGDGNGAGSDRRGGGQEGHGAGHASIHSQGGQGGQGLLKEDARANLLRDEAAFAAAAAARQGTVVHSHMAPSHTSHHPHRHRGYRGRMAASEPERSAGAGDGLGDGSVHAHSLTAENVMHASMSDRERGGKRGHGHHRRHRELTRDRYTGARSYVSDTPRGESDGGRHQRTPPAPPIVRSSSMLMWAATDAAPTGASSHGPSLAQVPAAAAASGPGAAPTSAVAAESTAAMSSLAVVAPSAAAAAAAAGVAALRLLPSSSPPQNGQLKLRAGSGGMGALDRDSAGGSHTGGPSSRRGRRGEELPDEGADDEDGEASLAASSWGTSHHPLSPAPDSPTTSFGQWLPEGPGVPGGGSRPAGLLHPLAAHEAGSDVDSGSNYGSDCAFNNGTNHDLHGGSAGMRGGVGGANGKGNRAREGGGDRGPHEGHGQGREAGDGSSSGGGSGSVHARRASIGSKVGMPAARIPSPATPLPPTPPQAAAAAAAATTTTAVVTAAAEGRALGGPLTSASGVAYVSSEEDYQTPRTRSMPQSVGTIGRRRKSRGASMRHVAAAGEEEDQDDLDVGGGSRVSTAGSSRNEAGHNGYSGSRRGRSERRDRRKSKGQHAEPKEEGRQRAGGRAEGGVREGLAPGAVDPRATEPGGSGRQLAMGTPVVVAVPQVTRSQRPPSHTRPQHRRTRSIDGDEGDVLPESPPRGRRVPASDGGGMPAVKGGGRAAAASPVPRQMQAPPGVPDDATSDDEQGGNVIQKSAGAARGSKGGANARANTRTAVLAEPGGEGDSGSPAHPGGHTPTRHVAAQASGSRVHRPGTQAPPRAPARDAGPVHEDSFDSDADLVAVVSVPRDAGMGRQHRSDVGQDKPPLRHGQSADADDLEDEGEEEERGGREGKHGSRVGGGYWGGGRQGLEEDPSGGTPDGDAATGEHGTRWYPLEEGEGGADHWWAGTRHPLPISSHRAGHGRVAHSGINIGLLQEHSGAAEGHRRGVSNDDFSSAHPNEGDYGPIAGPYANAPNPSSPYLNASAGPSLKEQIRASYGLLPPAYGPAVPGIMPGGQHPDNSLGAVYWNQPQHPPLLAPAYGVSTPLVPLAGGGGFRPPYSLSFSGYPNVSREPSYHHPVMGGYFHPGSPQHHLGMVGQGPTGSMQHPYTWHARHLSIPATLCAPPPMQAPSFLGAPHVPPPPGTQASQGSRSTGRVPSGHAPVGYSVPNARLLALATAPGQRSHGGSDVLSGTSSGGSRRRLHGKDGTVARDASVVPASLPRYGRWFHWQMLGINVVVNPRW